MPASPADGLKMCIEVAHRLEFSWVRLPASWLGGGCSVCMEHSHKVCYRTDAHGQSICVVSSFLLLIAFCLESQLPLVMGWLYMMFWQIFVRAKC